MSRKAAAHDLSAFEAGEPFAGEYSKTLEDLQERVAERLVAFNIYGRSAVILFEGWDASGKGGAIQRLTARCDPRHYQVWPIGAPTAAEKAHPYLWRFWTKLPEKGEIAIFDRSWYGRVLVERVEGFAARPEWERAYDEINVFEEMLALDGTLIVKIFLHTSAETQDKRLLARLDHPWKRWKISAEDFRNRKRRGDYLQAIGDMFARTDTKMAPWKIIDGNDKKAARIAVLRHVLDCLSGHVSSQPPPPAPEMEEYRRILAGTGTRTRPVRPLEPPGS